MDLDFPAEAVKTTAHTDRRQVLVEIEGADLEDVLANIDAEGAADHYDHGDLLDQMSLREIVDHHDVDELLDAVGREAIQEWIDA